MPVANEITDLQAPPSGRLLLGITEDNANLTYAPSLGPPAPAFASARADFNALHPSYIRLLVNWAAFQPQANQPAALTGAVDGCLRGRAPCGAFADLAAQLAAIKSRQESGELVAPVIAILGAPSWATAAVPGCPTQSPRPPSSPLSATGLTAYRMLIAEILAIGRVEHVALPYLAPWIEPNAAAFISPQHQGCGANAPLVSPDVYAQLVGAMGKELALDTQPHQMLLGELAQASVTPTHTSSIADFVAALPSDVLCASSIWTVHDYATWGGGALPPSPVSALEAALDARGGCAANARIWVTETGAGGMHPGRRRTGGLAGQRAGCRAEAAKLDGYLADPRIDAVFQYTFREDTDFPVGLENAALNYTYPTYALWKSWADRATPLSPAPLPAECDS